MFSPRKSTFCLLLSLCLTSLMPVFTAAWGQQGHRIVARIAAQHLTLQARREIAKLLGGSSAPASAAKRLADVANFADAFRPSHPETSRWHFVNIPRTLADTYDPSRDCQNVPGKGDCAIAAIERFEQTLGDTAQFKSRRAFALRFIVHLVGDLHQPLHCGALGDRGGNEIQVKYFGTSTNLHKVWDTLIIIDARMTDIQFAKSLNDTVTPEFKSNAEQGTLIDWGNASHFAAVNFSYAIPEDKQLADEYFTNNSGVVADQLLKGGIRLAKILNDTLQ